jgi:hypothetical protein
VLGDIARGRSLAEAHPARGRPHTLPWPSATARASCAKFSKRPGARSQKYCAGIRPRERIARCAHLVGYKARKLATMPSLTVRSFAELLHLPAYAHVRILTEQKYPRTQPQTFMVPFYQPSLSSIRAYYRHANDVRILADARTRVRHLENLARRLNNERVLTAFSRGRQARRRLEPISLPTFHAAILPDVDLRVSFDVVATENGRRVYILYNTRSSVLDEALASTTLRLAHWVLAENGTTAPFACLQYVDLFSGASHSVLRQSQRLLSNSRATARVISALWPTI